MTAAPTPEVDPAVAQALASRRSVRGFLPREVPQATVERLLQLAGRAPSGSNIQPWKVHVLRGAARAAFCARLQQAEREERALHAEEYAYYPQPWREPWLARRRRVGLDLYGLLGIARGDAEAMARQHARNFDFFGAPVGLVFTIDRALPQGAWLDYGTFLQALMVAARGAGLDTCPQQAFARYHRLIARMLRLPADEMVVCGMALGWADPQEPANALRTQRMALHEFVTVHEHLPQEERACA